METEKTGYELALELIEECKRTKNTKLELKSLELKSIPKEVNKCIWLEKLDLSGNQISKIENLDYLHNLNYLNLIKNKISKIENLYNLQKLTSLYLINNEVSEIANIDNLQNLIYLNLSNNQISKIENLDNKPNLSSLHLSNNQISKIENLNKLSLLQELRIDFNKITKIENLNELSQLRVLGLEHNSIVKVENLSKLNNLVQLCLSYNKIQRIENLENLQNLTTLLLGSNNITKTENLSNLPKIQRIYLEKNKILKIENLENLDNLILLKLRDNRINDLLQILPLIKLKKFKITQEGNSGNKTISIGGCPLENPPMEVVKQGTEAIFNYFEDLEIQGTDHIYEAKTLIIGKAGAGKTSLRYKLRDSKCQLPKANKSTKGIDVEPIIFHIPYKNKDFNVNIWDFGGQEIYHNTHQFFLTKRSLYVLVADYRTEKHELNYWMQIVEMMGGGSPLLIVQNEKDNRVGDLNLPGLKSQYSDIYKDDFRVDLRAICEGEHYKKESEKAFQQLQTEIQSKLLQLPHIGDVLPKQWVVIRKEIEKLAAQKAYITEDEFYDLCMQHKITDNQKQRDLSQYFHDLGVFLHFQNDDKPSALSEMVILQNTWATEAVYKVLDSTLVKDEQFGRFTYRDLKQIWQDSTWRSKAKELLELMMEFQLCYQIADTSEYIAPQLLPAQQPDYTWDKTSNLQLRYRYGFMPKGIITRFIVKMHKFIAEGQTLVWKEGVILEHQDAKAEVIETYRANEIHIRVSGSRGKELLTIIAHNIDELNGAFEKIRVDKLVPCNCKECKGLAIPNFYEYSDLNRRRKKGKRTIECKISYDDVNVLKLIDSIFTVKSKDKKTVRELIGKSDLKGAIHLLEEIIAIGSPLDKEFVVIRSNFSDLRQRHSQGRLKDDIYTVERANISAALLGLLEDF